MVSFKENRLRHIFRRAEGHFAEDTPVNRARLRDTVVTEHLLGTDRYGNMWYARRLPDGRQIWVSLRDGVILNGGVNKKAHVFSRIAGLTEETPGGRSHK